MRKEIKAIFIFFLIIFTITVLLSYSPNDPSLNNAKSITNIHNVFGLLGAYVASFLIGLFGVGSFWIPIILFIIGFKLIKNHKLNLYLMLPFAIILIISTASLLSFYNETLVLFANKFSTGGILGVAFKNILFKFTSFRGGTIILIVLSLISLIVATDFSFEKFYKYTYRFISFLISSLFLLIKQIFSLIIKLIKWIFNKKKDAKADIIKTEKSKKKNKTTLKKPTPKSLNNKHEEKVIDPDEGFTIPPISFLADPAKKSNSIDNNKLKELSKILENKLSDFGVNGKVLAIEPGPVITTFEYEPASGVKINKIVNLSDDLALALSAISIRIVAPIPGKAVVGIEIPNKIRENVNFKELITSPSYEKSKSKLTICLGKDIVGNPVVGELDKMPHLLIAGATGTGKSVCLNTVICSLLYKATPDEVRLIMIDPKRIELSNYNDIGHLIVPVVTDVKKATNALFWAVKEMEQRYENLAKLKVKNITQYNQEIAKDSQIVKDNQLTKLPYIVIIIDELADLMMVASRDVEVALTRLAQMARAAGIHLILATQRPSVDVLTGIIKANFPTRLTFQVSSKIDSRTIIDSNGAENLLGNGDMLFLPPGTAKLQRIHGAYISEDELLTVVEFLKAQKKPEYDVSITESADKETSSGKKEDYDEKYDEAVAFVAKARKASISLIQRQFRIGYNRAARIIEVMEKEGVIAPSDGVKAREVLVRDYDDGF